MTDKPYWKPQVKGDVNGKQWEISVVRSDNEHGQKSWGWFDDRKILISHNGGPCTWPLALGLGDMLVKVAELYSSKLNEANIQNLTEANRLKISI